MCSRDPEKAIFGRPLRLGPGSDVRFYLHNQCAIFVFSMLAQCSHNARAPQVLSRCRRCRCVAAVTASAACTLALPIPCRQPVSYVSGSLVERITRSEASGPYRYNLLPCNFVYTVTRQTNSVKIRASEDTQCSIIRDDACSTGRRMAKVDTYVTGYVS